MMLVRDTVNAKRKKQLNIDGVVFDRHQAVRWSAAFGTGKPNDECDSDGIFV